MPLLASAVGSSLGGLDVHVDHRWLMAYAAGIPDERPELYDTAAGVVAHPLFPVGPEWALITSQRAEATGLTADELRRGIHIAHDLQIERPLRPGTVHLDAHIVGVGRRRTGATQQTLFTATDADGAVLWRTLFTNLFLGVELVGDPVEPEVGWPTAPEVPHTDAAPSSATSVVRTVDAHVYSECARIWNPIHTDVLAARGAGLPAPILHGTATLARSVSLTTAMAGAPLASVRRIAGRFSAPVALGATFDVRLLAATPEHLWFDAVLPDGSTAIANGLLGLSD